MTTLTSPAGTTWNAWAAEGRSSHLLTDVELEHFARHLPLRCGHVAVDAGCGSGGFSRQLYRFGYDVTGLDYADAALTAARRTPLQGDDRITGDRIIDKKHSRITLSWPLA